MLHSATLCTGVFLFYIKRHLMSGNEFACSLGSSSAKIAWVWTQKTLWKTLANNARRYSSRCVRAFRLCSHLAYWLKLPASVLRRKPCFQKSPERFLKCHHRRLFLQLRASFQVEKSSNLTTSSTFCQLTNDKRVASRFHNKTTIAGRPIVLVSEHKEWYETVHHPAGAPGLSCWKHHTYYPV